jgi:SAM-dependent methyltransferase
LSERFEADWLALREPVDHRSRAGALLAPLQEWWSANGGSTVVDLGSGTGSNLRYLAPSLPGPQRWTLVDRDASLLAKARAPSPDVDVRAVEGELDEVGLVEAAAADLVTASALLDLVSEGWLGALADTCAGAGCAVLLALSYDGAIAWPGSDHPLDALVRDAVNRHQRRDKGLGPALGPTASAAADALFRAHGYRTRMESSPWRLGPEDATLAHAVIDGWAAAATEQAPDHADAIHAWAANRRQTAGAPGFALVVGHQDLLALPAKGR